MFILQSDITAVLFRC